jgi:hypothetical protein
MLAGVGSSLRSTQPAAVHCLASRTRRFFPAGPPGGTRVQRVRGRLMGSPGPVPAGPEGLWLERPPWKLRRASASPLRGSRAALRRPRAAICDPMRCFGFPPRPVAGRKRSHLEPSGRSPHTGSIAGASAATVAAGPPGSRPSNTGALLPGADRCHAGCWYLRPAASSDAQSWHGPAPPGISRREQARGHARGPQAPGSASNPPSGSSAACSRHAAVCTRRRVMALRRAPASLCSGAARTISPP